MNATSVLLCVPPISRRCGKRLTFEYQASKGLIWGFWRTTRFINPLTMCGYAAHWIWQLIRGRSSTPYIKATRKPPLQWGHDKSLKDTPRDLKQARRLLAQAGYPNGFTISLWAMPIQRPHMPN